MAPGKFVGHTGQLPRFDYERGVQALVMAFYENGFIVGFDWTSWQEEAERYWLDPEAVANADLTTVRRLITTHVRKDRFVEGHLAAAFEEGHIRALLARLEVIRQSEPEEGME